MASLRSSSSFEDLQKFQEEVFGPVDDRDYSTTDLLVQQQRFTMRALKGLRKKDNRKIEVNLIIALSWLVAVTRRFNINIDETLWKRFSDRCSYCGSKPCKCGEEKPKVRKKLSSKNGKKPSTVADFQKMFAGVYPASSRTLPDAGVHLAEEMGEVSEAVHNYMGNHTKERFLRISEEIADYISCLFGVANSADIDVAKGFSELFYDNCSVCHKAPCECSFSSVANFES